MPGHNAPPAPRPAQLSRGQKAGGAAAAIAAVALIVTPFTAAHEGRTLTPVRPVPGDVLTVCHGETRVAMRRYTPADCTALLNKAIASDYAPPVLACVPQLAENRYAFAASVDAAYNAGARRFCRSPMAARFRLRDWRSGCAAFRGWVETAGGRWLRGLANRRRDEAALCARGLA